MALRPCITCGRPSEGPRCPAHTVRNGSTRSWRAIRAIVLQRDGFQCQQCGGIGTEVDHIHPVSEGGTDHPGNLRALCHACHAAR